MITCETCPGDYFKSARCMDEEEYVDNLTGDLTCRYHQNAQLSSSSPTDEIKMNDMRLLTLMFNSGYMLGHHDTVESLFIDLVEADMYTYHDEVVKELLESRKKELLELMEDQS